VETDIIFLYGQASLALFFFFFSFKMTGMVTRANQCLSSEKKNLPIFSGGFKSAAKDEGLKMQDSLINYIALAPASRYFEDICPDLNYTYR
jgi:hypothetical protein